MPALDLRSPRFAWILGTGRCGSTLVHEVLARHAAVGFISNLEDRSSLPAWSGRWNNPTFRRVPPGLTTKGRLRYAPSEAYRLLEREVSPQLSTPYRDLTADDATPWLSGRLRATFETRARAQGRALFVHKLTGWPRSGLLEEVFPESRFVHIVRDGRAVANSWLQMDWWRGHRGPGGWNWGPLPPRYQMEWEAAGESFPLLAGIGWKILIDAFDSARAALPAEQWLELRYEDVLADPRRAFGEMLEFLELPMSVAFGRALARYEFRPGRADAFRRDLDPTSLQLLDISLGDHLARHGYGAGAPSRLSP
jgi:hypothetical protein